MTLTLQFNMPRWVLSPKTLNERILQNEKEKYDQYFQFLKQHKDKYKFNDEGTAVKIYKDITLGREGDLKFLNHDISRNHCKLEYRGNWFRGKWYISDLGSRFKTQIKRKDTMINVESAPIALAWDDSILLGQMITIRVIRC